VLYLDSSAIVKLVVREPESGALRRFLRGQVARASCGLARVDVPRAVAAHGQAAAERVHRVLAGLHLIQLDEPLLDAAGGLEVAAVRSIDAVHLAAARELGEDLACVVTYDRRMRMAAATLGLPVADPS
jgi:predicted nucleic acid-binding protein